MVREMSQPIGPLVDASPRPLPKREPLLGRSCVLEPLSVHHAPELWEAAAGTEESWTYLGYGPFAAEAGMEALVRRFGAGADPLFWAVLTRGRAAGWLALMDIQPENAAIELGNIWFSPAIQRTRAATEAMVMLLALAAGTLGYRRLVWKCNALNAASRRAAERLGFAYEGTLRAHMVIKGRQRDTAYYSLIAAEWPAAYAAMAAWLDDRNFRPDGTPRRSLAELRQGAA